MRSSLGFFSVLLLLARPCFSTSCRTCKNGECFKNDVLVISCNKNTPVLPFQTSLPKNKEIVQYGCLQLEYVTGNSVETLQQCIITEDINEFCRNIVKSVEIIQCNVDLPTVESTVKTDISNENTNVEFKLTNTFSSTQNDRSDSTSTPSIPNEITDPENSESESTNDMYETTEGVSTSILSNKANSENFVINDDLSTTEVSIPCNSKSFDLTDSNNFTTIQEANSSVVLDSNILVTEPILTTLPNDLSSSVDSEESNTYGGSTANAQTQTTDPSYVNDLEIPVLGETINFTTTERVYSLGEIDLTSALPSDSFNSGNPDKPNPYEDLTTNKPTNSYEFTTSHLNMKDLETTELANQSRMNTKSEEDSTNVKFGIIDPNEDSTKIPMTNSSDQEGLEESDVDAYEDSTITQVTNFFNPDNIETSGLGETTDSTTLQVNAFSPVVVDVGTGQLDAYVTTFLPYDSSSLVDSDKPNVYEDWTTNEFTTSNEIDILNISGNLITTQETNPNIENLESKLYSTATGVYNDLSTTEAANPSDVDDIEVSNLSESTSFSTPQVAFSSIVADPNSDESKIKYTTILPYDLFDSADTDKQNANQNLTTSEPTTSYEFSNSNKNLEEWITTQLANQFTNLESEEDSTTINVIINDINENLATTHGANTASIDNMEGSGLGLDETTDSTVPTAEPNVNLNSGVSLGSSFTICVLLIILSLLHLKLQ